MDDTKRFLKLLVKGEGEEVEFKRNHRSIADTVTAFANTYGGFVLVGIEDDGTVRGVGKRTKERVSTALHLLSPPPALSIRSITIHDIEVMMIEVEKSDALVFNNRTPYIRVGRSNRALTLSEMLTRSVELTQIHFDTQLSTIDVDILSEAHVRRYLRLREEVRGIAPRDTIETNLVKIKGAGWRQDVLKATYGGFLYFSDAPERYISGATGRVVIHSPSGPSQNIELSGPIWKLIDDMYSTVVSKVDTVEYRIGGRRTKRMVYPEGAIREAITNAFSHRNYLHEADVRAFIRKHELVIRSPGSFPPTIDIDRPEHYPRNPLLCQYLYDCGYIERYGFGIVKIREECEAHPFCDVRFDIARSHVDLIFSRLDGDLDEIDRKIVALATGRPVASSVLAENVGLSKVTVLNRLKKLRSLGEVEKIGRGPATRYLATGS